MYYKQNNYKKSHLIFFKGSYTFFSLEYFS